MQQDLDQSCPIPYDPAKNTTWIFHPRRTQLTAVEKDLGFRIRPESTTINNMTIMADAGDRFLIHTGTYRETFSQYSSNFTEDLSIIGIGGKCIIHNYGSRAWSINENACNGKVIPVNGRKWRNDDEYDTVSGRLFLQNVIIEIKRISPLNEYI